MQSQQATQTRGDTFPQNVKTQIMKTRTLSTLAQAQKALESAAYNVSKPLRNRAEEILRALAKDFPFASLKMGMGGWTFSGNAPVTYDDGTKGSEEIDRLMEVLTDEHAGYCYTFDGVTEDHKTLAKELLEILEFCTEPSNNVEIFDIDLQNDALSSETAPPSEYDTQATQFLTANGLKMRITLSDTKAPAWDAYQPMEKCPACKGGGRKLQGFPLGHHQTTYEQQRGLNGPIWAPCPACKGKGEIPDNEARKHGHHYRVTLSRAVLTKEFLETRAPSRLTFDFWGSIADADKGVTPTPYDVLACISGDAYTPETFADFCGEYGYPSDSLKALQTFRRCSAFAKRLRAFFTPAELETLSEIQ